MQRREYGRQPPRNRRTWEAFSARTATLPSPPRVTALWLACATMRPTRTRVYGLSRPSSPKSTRLRQPPNSHDIVYSAGNGHSLSGECGAGSAPRVPARQRDRTERPCLRHSAPAAIAIASVGEAGEECLGAAAVDRFGLAGGVVGVGLQEVVVVGDRVLRGEGPVAAVEDVARSASGAGVPGSRGLGGWALT